MNKVEKYLQENKIEYTRHDHEPVFTCEQAEKHCKTIPGIAGKNLFLKDKKGKLFLYVLPAVKRADLKSLAKVLDVKKLSFGSAELLMEKMGLEPGSVSPFGLLNDTEKEISVYIDEEIYNADTVNFHPNKNSASLEMTREMFHKYLETLEHEVRIVGKDGVK